MQKMLLQQKKNRPSSMVSCTLYSVVEEALKPFTQVKEAIPHIKIFHCN